MSMTAQSKSTALVALVAGVFFGSVVFGQGGGPALQAPRGVAIEASGDLVVVDFVLAAVVRVDPVTGDRTIESKGTVTFVLTRGDEGLRIRHLHWSSRRKPSQ